MISVSAAQGTIPTAKADAVVVFVSEGGKAFRRQVERLRKIDPSIPRAIETSGFSGKEKQTLHVFPGQMSSGQLILVGLGKTDRMSPETFRVAGACAAKRAHSVKARSIVLAEPDDHGTDSIELETMATALIEGVLLSSYRYDKYLTDSPEKSRLKSVVLLTENAKHLRESRNGVSIAEIVCEGTCLARDLANAPANEIYPETLARQAADTGRKHGFRVNTLNEKKIKALGMGGLIGVAQGSERPPRFIIMEYTARARRQPTIVLVGKGVTFDSGGISIKPSQGMAEMKMDMSGAAAVIGTMAAAARLKLPVRLIGLIPATENLLGGSAMKPGDILTHLNGKTSEVDNTDAEGRLILADALSYASRYKPDLVVDLATLTGACVVALGHAASGMMGNDQEMMDRLKEAGERTHERVWQLPLFEEYEKLIKSHVADVKNVGGRWAGAITAALFLKKFIGDYRWIHLDIAGPAILEEDLEYAPRGGSGVGVRLLIDFLKHWKKS